MNEEKEQKEENLSAADFGMLLQIAAAAPADEAVRILRPLTHTEGTRRAATLVLYRKYAETERFDEALALLDDVLKADADFAEGLYLRGGLRHRLHDSIGAADDLRRALTLKPELVNGITGDFSTLDRPTGRKAGPLRD